uniref:FYVE-type domain-containing protein n=1 Tax=Hyaloperonospora arabidopsidis (strain Emoy2) TaxID=559515 RepID=M4B873_HYAAE
MNRSVGTSEAIRLAQASDWKSLQRLLERDPASATYRGDHGMLPLHWACTVRHVPLSLIAKLLQAYPESVATKNDGDLLPLQIAIRAGVQAACLRKLVRAYPDAVSERMPDGGTALEMAEANGLEADKLKVLYRAYDRSSNVLQQQQKEQQNDDDDGDDLSGRGSEGLLDLERVTSEQEEGEASGVERVLRDEGADNDVGDWTEAAGPEPFVGNISFNGGFLPDDDDEGALNTGEGSTLEQRDSISMMSEQSLSDMDGLDTLHDQLVSPSSISTGSRDETRNSHSGRSSFDATQVCSGSNRGSPLRGFQKWSHQHSTSQQRHTTSSLSGQFQNNGFASDRGQRIMSSAMRVDAGVRNARGGEEEDDEVGGRRRGHSRHSSLPVMLNHERVRQNAHSGFHNEADDDVEHVGKDNGSPRDSISPGGGVVCAQVNLQDRLFHSVREFPRRSMPRTGSQRSSPPFFQSRASHGSINDRGHNDLRPEWKHDDECSICRASFGMFKHRHHCRNCGKSICSQHSADKKISMEAKGFTTPQRVCVTCYAMITHSRGRKHELEQAETGGNDSLLDVYPHQHIALGAGDNDQNGVRGASFPSATVAIPGRGFARENSQSPTISNGSLDASPTTGTHEWSFQKSSVIAAGEATGGAGERVTALNHAPRQNGSSSSSPFSSSSAVHELRSLLASQQKQIQQLAQSNLQMQQQLLEHDHVKTETMRFLNQLITRVSILELQTDCSARINKRRSAETGESEDDEEFPHDEDHK